MPTRVAHLNAHLVASLQERRLGLALGEGFDGAQLGEAGVADSAFGDRFSWTAVRPAIRHGARSDDRARSQGAGPGRVGDQRPEIEGHVDPGVGAAERAAVEVDAQSPVQLAVPPAVAQRPVEAAIAGELSSLSDRQLDRLLGYIQALKELPEGTAPQNTAIVEKNASEENSSAAG